jgi:hypothetical protein
MEGIVDGFRLGVRNEKFEGYFFSTRIQFAEKQQRKLQGF